MDEEMGKVYSIIKFLVVDKNIEGNGRMGNFMVKEHSLGAMVIVGVLGFGRGGEVTS